MTHTTHSVCKEIMERDGGKAIGCCCTGHKCKDMPDYDLFIKSGLAAGFTDSQLNFLEYWVFDYLPEPEASPTTKDKDV